MLHIVLFEPEIPPNTGNIIRLAANTGCHLHLIKPLGFALEDKLLRRAGLDYHEWADIQQHESLKDFKKTIDFRQLYAFSTKGKRIYSEIDYQPCDALLFGPETRGLPTDILNQFAPEDIATLPMLEHSRSLNLANTVSIAVYEAWRQMDFKQ
ncbi:MAG: tRNA (uridine(34)/cytosine(34)/5-carboxymethylaminomethyluridine(34)-2'-O)-methyltransferase TrmL [Gammaproteobacteria bacterium]|nr:tRNA (uridine(34)/cytosine(34)/5-carboxymethylaminomethyluridine(34)-2'-O)-methyltransferase TrmL [Gammaproteobacteria bacterium]